jgi:hypothetical protein
MRLIHTVPLAAAILLAACGGNADDAATDEGSTVSRADAATAAQSLIQPRAGQYKVALELLDFQAPGVPDAGKARLREIFASGLAEGNTFCLTPEQAARGGAEQMVKNFAESDCTVGKFNVSGNTVSSEMQCPGEQGGTRTVKLDGQMTAESSTMTMETSQNIPNAGATSMKIRVNSQRIGDCSA